MAGYSTRNVTKDSAAQVVGASVTAQAVTNIFNMSSEDAKYFRAVLEVSGVTVGAGITASLQHTYKKTATFKELSPAISVSITGNGEFELEFDVSEANNKPTWPLAQIVITTGVGSAITVDNVIITRVL